MKRQEQYLELKGTVEQIIFRSEKNGYTVLALSSDEEEYTAVGIMPGVSLGENVKLKGYWSNHPNFGKQFKAEACEQTVPEGSQAILRYLSGGAIKGLGQATAKKIVDKFGERTLEVIVNEPEKLVSIKGITLEKAKTFSQEYKNIFGVKEAMAYFTAFGILPEEVVKIWKAFGAESIKIIKENPYRICDENVNISFDKADSIAQELDFPKDFAYRIQMGIIYILKHNLSNGHTCLPKDKLIPLAAQFLEISSEQIQYAINEMCENKDIHIESIEEIDFVFLKELYEYEKFCSWRLSFIIQHPPMPIQNTEQEIRTIQEKYKIDYAKLQKQAITEALNKGILIMTGGPGTGKTTTIKAIIEILESKKQKVLLAAPTGRAAKRLSQVTGRYASTIHKMLGAQKSIDDKPIFIKNQQNLLRCDALILDEISMVDIVIFQALLKALPIRCRLILVGDYDQLPSVGPGNILKDMIFSGVIPLVKLSEVFRQSLKSLIVANAHRIVRGEPIDIKTRNNDFFFLESYSYKKIKDIIVDLYSKRLKKAYGLSPVDDVQILCPGRRGDLGSLEFNQKLQEIMNPAGSAKRQVSIGDMILREGDKVMQIRNNYDIIWEKSDGSQGEGIFNGDIGILRKIDTKASNVILEFDDNKIAYYSMEHVKDLELAYAITVHKSQGSEFKAVIMPMYKATKHLCYRNLLYTGVTRAKSILIMVGSPATVDIMIQNNRKTNRYTALCHFLKLDCTYENN